MNNLNDGMAWGLFPIFFAKEGLSIAAIGVLAGIYPAIWERVHRYTVPPVSTMRSALGIAGWVAVAAVYTVLVLETGRAVVITIGVLVAALWELAGDW